MDQRSSLSLGSTSDLVVAAPWRDGIIQADEPILPKTRLALTFRTIFALLKAGREAAEVTAFAGPIDRLEQIHSFRFAAEEEGMRLSVTFDFAWEGYFRALWRDAGAFLDLLCCHCAGYRLARTTPVDEWRRWILANQRTSDYFYSSTGLTVGDLAALAQGERAQRDENDSAAADRRLAGLCSEGPTAIAARIRQKFPEKAQRQAIAVISGMYALTRYWGADVRHSVIREDAITLLLATRGLLEDHYLTPGSLPVPWERRYPTELAWYRQPLEDTAAKPGPVALRRADVQRGVITSHNLEAPAPMSHGAMLFLAVTDAAKARQSLARLPLASEDRVPPRDGIFRNLAFTYAGLERLQLPAEVRDAAPAAFREGAARRAGLVGDVRASHPSRWQALRRNWGPRPEWTVELPLVDVLIQLRTSDPGKPIDIADPAHPLHGEIERLAGSPNGPLEGLALLAVEGLAPAAADDVAKDHLGFQDGLSQPDLDAAETRPWSDKVEPGALLVGLDGSGDAFWRGGSFLAVRRMTIDRSRFEALMTADCTPPLNQPALLAGKMVGRMPDGTPLAPAYGRNNFTYDGDEAGTMCPLHSHVRRANPRCGDPPRIMRRGMSFGPPVGSPDDAERGSMFMAYCADLAEQYERVLTWVNGGNSTRLGSFQADPMMRVPDLADPQTFRFMHKGSVHRLSQAPAGRGFIGLSWSLYLFAPSLSAIRALAAVTATAAPPQPLADLTTIGADEQSWRKVLNEPLAATSGATRAVWAAVRAAGGIVKTPVGYLVGSQELVLEVLQDDGARFSNHGAGERMAEVLGGPFHLGLDPCTPRDRYQALATPANEALRSIDEAAAFDVAFAATGQILGDIFKRAGNALTTIDIVKDLLEPLLAMLGTAWFGIPDGDHVEAGQQHWQSPETRKPRCPGDFWSPSRMTFNPFRSDETDRLAALHGTAIVDGVTRQIEAVGRCALAAPVAKRLAAARQAYPSDRDLARVLVGSMIGMVPTLAGNAARLLATVLDNRELERAQMRWLLTPATPVTPYQRAKAEFGTTIAAMLQRAPVPELLWRVVAREGVALGSMKDLEVGSRVIFSLESAGMDQLGRNRADPWIAFGMAAPSEPQPPHGCPGRAIALGALLGLVAGLVETARFRPVGLLRAEVWPLG